MKILFAALVLCFNLLQAFAQTAPIIDLFEPVGEISYTIAFDVDLDGDLDVVVSTNQRLFWLEQLEDGRFSKQNVISTEPLAYRTLVSADIDEDGDEDLIYGENSSGVSVHFNQGDGTFSEAVEIHNLQTASIDTYVSDINSDGHLDIITCSSTEVRWLPGDGDGTFAASQLISDQHTTTTSLHSEDLDGDGDNDIAIAALFSNRLAWHENLGDGTFSEFMVIDTTYKNPRAIDVADLDGDNLPDIACTYRFEEEGDAGLAWYRNTGNGNFEFMDTLMGGQTHQYIKIADLDLDGDLDLVSCHRQDKMSWLENDGNGNFSDPIELEKYANSLWFVETPDINNDGFPDLLYGIYSSNVGDQTVLWRPSIGDGNFEPPSLLALGVRNVSNPIVADFDQDGLMDVAVGSDRTHALVWLKNEGYQFGRPQLIARRQNYSPSSIATGDFNNDGIPDILAGSIDDDATGSSAFSIYSNDGQGDFTASPFFETFYNPHRDLQPADMDNDGDLDMLWSQPGPVAAIDSRVGWVRSNGTNWGEPVILFNEDDTVLDVLAADFGEDGNTDLIICKREEPELGLMMHIGDGEYSELQEIPSDFTGALYAQAADIDGDGMTDLLASNESSTGGTDQISWWRNYGKGQFDSQQLIYAGDPPLLRFVFQDFDLDGRKDIVACTYLPQPMIWLKQLSDGTFSDPITIENTADKVEYFELEDIDGDGDFDIVGLGEDTNNGSTSRVFVTYNLANDQNISGVVYLDENANGSRDTNEVGIERFPISVEPQTTAIFANENGGFSIYGASGAYTISPELDDCWTLTTSPASYTVAFDGSNNIDSLEFGVAPNTQTPEANLTLTSAPTRCGFTVPFWLNYRNDGCWTFDGEVYLVLNNLATFVSATPEPTAVVGDTLYWSFTALPPGASRSVDLTMTIAGVDFIGSTLAINSGVTPFDNDSQPLAAIDYDFFSIINCAYDPNDKLVEPQLSQQPPYTENYTLFEDTILYTVRFQNTGTDTAFNVVIRDQLSTDLDWSTFRPGSSSHAYEATLHDDGLVEFHFRDILLPDSTTNEPASHGFVQFEINAVSGLEEGVIIENTAGIYFDFNPPIITNTVNNMMVEMLPDFTPEAAFDYSAEELAVMFTDVSSNNPAFWQWDFGDGQTSTEQSPLHTYAEAGTYDVCLTAGNDWGSGSNCEEINLIITSTKALVKSQFMVYPNPANAEIVIECDRVNIPQELVLYDMLGKALQSFEITEPTSSRDISTLPSGSYWIRTSYGQVLPLTIIR